MSNKVDDRVVNMVFDNKTFEEGIAQTTKSLDIFKNALNMGGAAKGFSTYLPTLKTNLSGIANNIDTIASRFTNMGLIGVTMLQNLANQAFNAGQVMLKSLTIDPLTTGWNEYELKMGAIQTIMAGSGESLASVNGYLNDLNEYSDKTIYSFADMTQNIGKFTNAGVKLPLAVQSIQGIANAAALSGANANEASRAMYNFAQALSQGSVRLIDWKSIELANMGTAGFKDQIIQTALAMGTLKKGSDGVIRTMKGTEVSTKNFQYTLDEAWFSADVLTTTLAKYADTTTEVGKKATEAATQVKTFSQLMSTLRESAQSGWAQTWEILIGNFEEGKELFTNINKIVSGMLGKQADARNGLLQAWRDMGGREKLMEALGTIWMAFYRIVYMISQVFREFFPKTTAKDLMALTEGFKTFAGYLQMSGETAGKVKKILRGFFALIDIVGRSIKAITIGFLQWYDSLELTSGPMLDFLVNIADMIVQFREGLIAGYAFEQMEAKIKDTLIDIQDAFQWVIDKIKLFKDQIGGVDLGTTGSKFTDFIENLKLKFAPMAGILDAFGKVIVSFVKFIEWIAPGIAKLGTFVADGLASFFTSMADGVSEFDADKFFAFINSALLAGLLKALTDFVKKGTGALDSVVGILDGVRGSLQAIQNNIKADTLLKIAVALAVMVVSLMLLASIDGNKLVGALGAMSAMFAQLAIAFTVFQKSAGGRMDQMVSMSVGIIAVATALLIMATAVSILGKMSGKQQIKGMMAIVSLSLLMVVTSKLLADSSKDMIKGAASMVIFGLAIQVLGKAVGTFGAMEPEKLQQGLMGMSVTLLLLAAVMKILDKTSGLGVKQSAGLLVIVGALWLLTYVIEKLGKMPVKVLVKGLGVIGAIMLGFAGFLALIKGSGGGASVLAAAASFAILAGSLWVLTDVIERLGKLSWDQIIRGMTAMGAALIIVLTAMYNLPKDMLIKSAALVMVAGALYILAEVLTKLGGMTWEDIVQGLVALGGAMAIIAIGLQFMANAIPGALALMIVSAGLLMLAPALLAMGQLSWQEVVTALLALAGVFVILGLASYVLTPMIPSMLALAVALGVLGLATLAFGVGILALSVGLGALAVGGTAGVMALGLLITTVAGLIPAILKQLGKGILIIVDTLVQGAPTLLAGVVTLLTVLLEGLIAVIPNIVEVIILLVEGIIEILVKEVPKLIKAGWVIITAIFTGMRDNIGNIVTLVSDFVVNFLTALQDKLPEIIDAGWDFILALIDGITLGIEDHMPALMVKMTDLGIAILKGLVDGWLSSREILLEALNDIGKTIIDAIKSALGIESPSVIFFEIGVNAILGFINGITSMVESVIETINTFIATILVIFIEKGIEFYNLGVSFLTELKDGITATISIVILKIRELVRKVLGIFKEQKTINDWLKLGKDIVQGLANGIKNNISLVIKAAEELGGRILKAIKQILNVKSPSKETYDIGKEVDAGLTNGILAFAKDVYNAASEVGNKTIDGLTNALTGVNDFVNANVDMEPTIRPVLDLTDIRKQADKIGSYVDKGFVLPVSGVTTANNISNSMARSNEVEGATKTPQNGSVLSFVQNNYSPKALSPIDIYRQTRNQLLPLKQLKGVNG